MEKMFEHYDIAVSMDPDTDRSPVIHATIAKHHARNGLYKKAIAAAEKGLQFATVSGNKDLETSIKRDIDSYQRKLSR
jgi:hypothetical protein